MSLPRSFTLSGVFVPALILFLANTVIAQNVYPRADSIQMSEVSLSEVEIVSMRESGRLSQLPLSASVINRAEVQERRISTLRSGAPFVANVFMPDYGSRLTSPVYIRGVGSRINAPSVGLYVDNIPYFEKSVFEFDLLNVERIEVLRGPQGTLYGRNTMGGLINVYSQSPFAYKGTNLLLTGGNPGFLNAGVSHFQPVTGNTAVAISAGLKRHDGFFKNEFLETNADAHLSAAVRIRAAWQINSALKAEFTTHYEHLDQGGYPYAIFDAQTAASLPLSYNRASTYKRQMSSNGLVFTYNTPLIKLQSVSAFQYYDDNQSIDQDFTVADLAFATQAQSQWMVSQEFTARSQYKGPYQWVMGVFGFNQKVNNDLAIDFGADAVRLRMVPGLLTRSQISGLNTFGAAVFHQSSLQHFVIRNLTITAGLRLDYETANLDFNSSIQAAFPVPPPNSFNSELEFYELVPRFAMSYEIKPGSSLYAAIVRGYKSGGFNTVFETEKERSFSPEFSWNYEFGIKGSYFKDRVSLQTSLFYIDWKNQQIFQMLSSGQGSLLKNAGASVSKGLEIDINAIIAKGLQFQGSYGYTHATFVENRLNAQVDYSGNFIPYVPRYTLFAGLRYHHTTNSTIIDAVRFQIGWLAVGDHYWNEANTSLQTAYGTLNAMIGLDARYVGLDLFVNNATSTNYHSFLFAALGRQYIQQGKPLTFGLTLRYSF